MPPGGGSITLDVGDPTRAMATLFEYLGSLGVAARAASLTQPSLDDVFLRETGRSLRDTDSPAADSETAEVAA